MPKRPVRRKATWMEISVKHAAFRSAIAGLKWAYSWAFACEALGHEPTVDEVAGWWRMSRRTAFRAQAAFREAFPELETPAPLCDPEMRKSIREHFGLTEKPSTEALRKLTPSDSDILRFAQRPSQIPFDQIS